MRHVILQITSMIQLTRLTSALAVVGNAWFVVLWSRSESHIPYPLPPELSGPWWQPLSAATLVALGLYAFGAALNDILDLRRDRLLRTDRPLAAGALGIESAVWIVVVTCGLSILGATWFGEHAILLTLLLQLGVLTYHAAARFVPGIGLVILGAIHAGHMLIPNMHLGFFWPVWFIFVHSTSVAGIAHVIGRKVPKLSRRALVAVALGLAAMTALAIRWPDARSAVPITAWIAPCLLAGAFALWVVHLIRRHGPGSRVAEKVTRYGALWMPLYGTAWLLGADRPREGMVLGVLAVVASLGVALAREAYGLLTEPIGYRR